MKKNRWFIPLLMIIILLGLVSYHHVDDTQSSLLAFTVPVTHADDDDRYEREDDDNDRDHDDDDRYESTKSNAASKSSASTSVTPTKSTTATLAAESQPMQLSDVNMGEQSLEYYMNYLLAMGVISSNDAFYSQMYVPSTRADTVRVLLLTAGVNVNGLENTAAFSDVTVSNPNNAYIAKAKQLGIIKGYEDGTFRPNSSISRAEALKIILKTYGINLDNKSPRLVSFPDVDTLHWASSYIEFAKHNTIINGYGNGTFGVDNSVTRAELAKISLRAAKILSADTYYFPPLFSDDERNVLLAQHEALLEEQRKMALAQAEAKATNNQPAAPTKPAPVQQAPATVPTPPANQPVVPTADQQAAAAAQAAAQQKAAAEAAAKQKAAEAAAAKAAALAKQAAANAQSSGSTTTTTKRS